ncbi:MAG TPA: peptide chain release factor N(5)-glutamine methyltransferase [Steroidobacteraceae bacterium]|nr:peptide chain release factor N(5)-glutamine methyltransferase [Steroidobacteraceae bacterium]
MHCWRMPPPGARVCDLGTGAGTIALALAAEHPTWRITATDLSAAALEVAIANARRLGFANIEFLLGDWLAPVRGRAFELIVSNPPYIARHDPALEALRHEPLDALTPGVTGLESLRRLIQDARAHLRAGGWLVLEHGAQQREAVAAALVEAGYARVRCQRDLAGHDRISEGQWS